MIRFIIHLYKVNREERKNFYFFEKKYQNKIIDTNKQTKRKKEIC
jgi:hypothetical protein